MYSFIDLTCPDDCTDPTQGECDTNTGYCICEYGFKGDNCAGKNTVFIKWMSQSGSGFLHKEC